MTQFGGNDSNELVKVGAYCAGVKLAVLAAALALAAARGVSAQNVRGTVHDSVSGRPVTGAVLTFLDSAEVPLARTITDGRGGYSLPYPARTRTVRVVRLGFRARTIELAAG